MRTVLAAALCLAIAVPALAQPAPRAPWDGDILPPAPAWKGKSERVIARPNDPWITPAERTNLTATPTYAETMAFIARMDAASDLIRVETFGRSAQGRDMVAVLVSKDGAAFDPSKPVLLFQGGIHSGEIDGKDAGLMLLRDIAFKGKGSLLDRANLIFIPVLNADGHERSSPFSRPNQRGPTMQGWRHTAQNLNLNRDYLKADAPEMQALLGLITRYDPDLYVDLHVTDGMDYQFDITFGFDGWDGRYADSPAIGKWLNEAYRPKVEGALKTAGHIPAPMLFGRNEADPAAGIGMNAFTPRYSHAYGDLRRLPTVLVENHSLKSYRQRVLGTYVLLEATLRAAADDAAGLNAAIAADRALRPEKVITSWRNVREPAASFDFLPVRSERVTSPASGGQVTRYTGEPAPAVKVPVYVSEPAVELAIPKAYWIPGAKPEVIARLALHGVAMQTVSEPATVEVQMDRLGAFTLGAPQEGRFPVNATGFKHETRRETFPAGSVRIPTDQPLGALIATLLEPESGDSLFAWGFFPEILQRVEYMEPYAIAPMAERMLAADPALKAEFEARLAADPAFAASPAQRLRWFYEKSPFSDDRYLLYPVGREVR